MEVTFHHDSIPSPGSRVFVQESKTGTMIYTPDMKIIGTSPVRLGAMPLSSGIARVVSADTINLHYIGPLAP
jgi:hypothetical protein